jgi:DNA-directed RNA polymerase specialized sigma24 family protein
VISWRRRGAARERPTDRFVDCQVAGPATEVLDRVVLRQALRSLSPGERAVLVLRFFEDLSEQQTADLLGCSVGTVKSQTSRGLAALRRVGDLTEGERLAGGK